jgi:type IV secretion system protein VirD4
VVPPSDIDRTRPLIRLMLNQIGRRLTETMEFGPKPAYRHRLLLLLDEFPSLGKLSFFQTSLAYLAGYGIKAYLIAQSLNQLQATYGQDNSILDNCHIRLTYTANDEKTAKRISDLIGQGTHTKLQRNYSGGALFRKVNPSEQEHARPLLTPDEVLRLPYDDALLLVGGSDPYRARKIMYYLDPRFKDAVDRPPPDSERQRRGELFLVRSRSDWEDTLAQLPPPPEPVATAVGGPAPALAVSLAKPDNQPSSTEPEVSHAKPADDEVGAFDSFAAFMNRPPEPGASSPEQTATEVDDGLPV